MRAQYLVSKSTLIKRPVNSPKVLANLTTALQSAYKFLCAEVDYIRHLMYEDCCFAVKLVRTP